MILVIGGAASGKLDYVKSLGYSDEQVSDGCIDKRPVVYNLQDLVAEDPSAAPGYYDDLVGKEVVICNEVGSGVIPIARETREAREQTGRLCNRLARVADRVVRIVSGIPMVIKG
ncbi:MAG: bifunctional adenosylcobinamide kinase/adenosylcobinamide-phosphate guanylyltransferase [Coriobacteriales bacterium]|jgi:adenosylcobinamide kinase/adenosylcobinamide-phosphate guanylyltransferase